MYYVLRFPQRSNRTKMLAKKGNPCFKHQIICMLLPANLSIIFSHGHYVALFSIHSLVKSCSRDLASLLSGPAEPEGQVRFLPKLVSSSQNDAWKKLKLPKVGKGCLKLSFFLWFTHWWNRLCETDWLGVGKDIKEILKFYKNELRL